MRKLPTNAISRGQSLIGPMKYKIYGLIYAKPKKHWLSCKLASDKKRLREEHCFKRREFNGEAKISNTTAAKDA